MESDARQIWMAGLDSVMPCNLFDRAVLNSIARSNPEVKTSRYLVVGCGKAALAMSAAFFKAAVDNQDIVDPSLIVGLITVPHGYRSTLPGVYEQCPAIEVIEAGHPLPDAASVAAVNRTVDFLDSLQLTERDCVVVLVSGGGSANWGAPVNGLALSDLDELTTSLLHANVDIIEINSIRRLLTRFGRGGLLNHTGAARVVSVIISDVPGTDLSFVASGPTHRTGPVRLDTTKLKDLGVPPTILRLLNARAAVEGRYFASSKTTVKHLLLADNRTVLSNALQCAASIGYETPGVLELRGEAGVAGAYLANRGLQCVARSPFALIAGGETTVTVRGHGSGGRNQEVAVAAVPFLAQSKKDIVILSAGTDGIDGPTNAAGGIVNNRTLERLNSLGVRVDDILARNDSFNALASIDSLFETGPTHTNVMDLAVVLVAGQ
jgi:glycerate-2-kinase